MVSLNKSPIRRPSCHALYMDVIQFLWISTISLVQVLEYLVLHPHWLLACKYSIPVCGLWKHYPEMLGREARSWCLGQTAEMRCYHPDACVASWPEISGPMSPGLDSLSDLPSPHLASSFVHSHSGWPVAEEAQIPEDAILQNKGIVQD